MSEKQIFVGRQEELEEFKKVLENPQGQAVIVVGQAGMGKTFLVNKMAEIAAIHPSLKCGCVRYEVTPTDTVDSTMALMVDNAFEAAQIAEGSFAGTERRLEQWKALLNIINLGDLVLSLRRDPAKHTRDQFIDRLNLISKKMPENGRAIFIIDPEKYMQEKSDQSWAIVVKDLPEKIKFIFAQRNEDMLVISEVFNALKNVVRIPEKHLDVLDNSAVDELISLESSNIKYPISEIKKVISVYEGHPYAVGAALELLKAGVNLEKLPKRPEPIKFAEIQWKEICKRSEEAIRLFRAYAILEVGVPDEITEYVSRLDSYKIQHLSADNYLKGLLRDEGGGKRIYHSILADYILGQIGDEEKKKYHKRAVKIYRGELKKAREEQIKPDELAATRLPEHVLEAEGPDAFVSSFIHECYGPLSILGASDTCISLSERALNMVRENSEEQSILLGNLGLIYQMRGELEKAEEMHIKSLQINEKLGRLQGTAHQFGNLGLIYQIRGELDKAEEMFNKVLDIAKRLSRPDIMVKSYCNLGVIYQMRGELDKAEKIYKKVLAVDERFGLQEEMARDYNNLGLIYRRRGELDKAEEMHKKALAIDERLGLREGIASNYAALGLVYYDRQNLGRAEEMHIKGLEIEKKLGRFEGVARQYGNLGLIYLSRGDLDKAEEIHKKALAIDERLGRQNGIARDYDNLGLIYAKRGDLKKAKGYWVKSLDLYKKIGVLDMVKKVQGWIDTTEGGGEK